MMGEVGVSDAKWLGGCRVRGADETRDGGPDAAHAHPLPRT